MTTFEAMLKVEDQLCQIERARAVLHAATEEVEDYGKYKRLRDEHVTLLLHVADGLLYEMSPDLKAIVDDLQSRHKAEKEDESA